MTATAIRIQDSALSIWNRALGGWKVAKVLGPPGVCSTPLASKVSVSGTGGSGCVASADSC